MEEELIEQNKVQCYAYIWNNTTLNGFGQCPMTADNLTSVEISDEVYDSLNEDILHYIWDAENQELIANPNYDQDKEEKEKQEMLQRTLTASDVERALLKAKGWDFEDLKTYLKSLGYSDLMIKAIGVELRANSFYRGAKLNDVLLFDTIGALLGYTSEDMDYLFVHKELPTHETSSIEDEESTDAPTD